MGTEYPKYITNDDGSEHMTVDDANQEAAQRAAWAPKPRRGRPPNQPAEPQDAPQDTAPVNDAVLYAQPAPSPVAPVEPAPVVAPEPVPQPAPEPTPALADALGGIGSDAVAGQG